jgi:hypothetical protein
MLTHSAQLMRPASHACPTFGFHPQPTSDANLKDTVEKVGLTPGRQIPDAMPERQKRAKSTMEAFAIRNGTGETRRKGVFQRYPRVS